MFLEQNKSFIKDRKFSYYFTINGITNKNEKGDDIEME